jgi:hypothetical protein
LGFLPLYLGKGKKGSKVNEIVNLSVKKGVSRQKYAYLRGGALRD